MAPVTAIRRPVKGRRLARMSEKGFLARAISGDRERVEWINGELQPMSPVNLDHGELQAWLLSLLKVFAETKDLGTVIGPEYLVRLMADGPRHRMPDVLFVSKARTNLLTRQYLDGAPDLVVEVVSPDNPARDYRVKFLEYQEAGVKEYWIVDPSAQLLQIHIRNRAGAFVLVEPVEGRLHSKAVKGLWIDPNWLFAMKRPTVLSVLKQLGVL